MDTGSDHDRAGSAEDAAPIAGKFRLFERIGQDEGFDLYRAERICDFAQSVAIRVPRPDSALPANVLVERLRTAQRALAPLHHPGIAALVDASLDPAAPWLAVEFAEGVALDEYCANHALSPRARIALFAHVLEAVAFAHRHLVVHGKLTFAHIRVDDAGTPRLIGFGGEALAALGDPHEPLSTAADLRDSGRLLFALLAGKPLPAQLPELTPRPSSLCTGAAQRLLRGDLDAILRRALAADAANSYPDAGALAGDLRNYLARLPVEAREGGFFYRIYRFAQRNRLVAGALLLLALIVAGSTAVVVRQSIEARHARLQAEARLADMQRLTDSLLGQLSGDLARLPGSEPVQALLIQNISNTLDQMDSQAGADPVFRQNLAREYLLLAQLLQQQPQQGLTPQQAAARGLEVLAPLLAANPSPGARRLETELRAIR